MVKRYGWLGFLAVAGWGLVSVIVAGDDAQQRLAATVWILAGSLGGGLWWLFVTRRPDAGTGQGADPYRLRGSAEAMIAAGRLPPRAALEAEIADIVRTGKILGVESRAHGAPPRGSAFASAIVVTLIRSWGGDTVGGLSTQRLAQLFLLHRIMCGPEDEVERRIVDLADPGPARALRETRQDHDRVFAAFEAERGAARAALDRWEEEGRVARYFEAEDLVGFLRDMAVRDVDLWHDIAVNAEPGLKLHADALYWIAAQPDCDRATVAAFIGNHARLGYLAALVESEFRRGSTEFADQMAAIVGRWNDGYYRGQALAWDGRNSDDARANYLRDAARVAALLGRPAWPEPVGLFRRFDGRKTAATFHFSHERWLYVLPPLAWAG